MSMAFAQAYFRGNINGAVVEFLPMPASAPAVAFFKSRPYLPKLAAKLQFPF